MGGRWQGRSLRRRDRRPGLEGAVRADVLGLRAAEIRCLWGGCGLGSLAGWWLVVANLPGGWL